MRARARAGTAAAAASAAVGGAKAKPAKPKPKYSADDHNRPDGVRWSDLPSGTAVMVSGNCPGVAAEPGEVVPGTICDGSEQEMHPVTHDGQVSIAGGVFPNRDGRSCEATIVGGQSRPPAPWPSCPGTRAGRCPPCTAGDRGSAQPANERVSGCHVSTKRPPPVAFQRRTGRADG